MSDHLVHAEQAVSQPAPGVGSDVGAGLIIAVIVAVVIIRYLKVILLLLAVAVVMILVGGGGIDSLVAEIEPLVTRVLDDLRSATGK